MIINRNINSKKIEIHSRREIGQSLLLIAFVLVGMIGMLVLVLDVGQTYMWRRQAQTAADAGAYAGASILCKGGTSTEAGVAADNYVTANDADVLSINVDTLVTVVTKISFNTFFGNVLGHPAAAAEATAAAGCMALGSASDVMPIAFTCRPPVLGSPTSSEDCAILGIPYNDFKPHMGEAPDVLNALYPNDLYVIIDSTSVNGNLCAAPDEPKPLPAGQMDCDLDDDGVNDLLAGGDKAWLNLDGLGGSGNELKTWVAGGGYPGEIFIHTWVPGEPGTVTATYIAFIDYQVGNIVLIPIIDQVCPYEPDIVSIDPDTDPCMLTTPSHGGVDYTEDYLNYTSSSSTPHYHIIGFAAFYVSCVVQNAPDYCPGHQALQDDPEINLANNEKAIEGYFLEGYTWSSGSVDPGGAVDGLVKILLLTE